jgi:hypothetical protein
MAKSYNLTLELNLRGPSNLKTVTSRLKKELSAASSTLNINVDKRSLSSIDSATNKIKVMASALERAQNAAAGLNRSLKTINSSFGKLQRTTNLANRNLQKINAQTAKATKNFNKIDRAVNKSTKSIKNQIRSIASYSIINRAIGGITSAFDNASRAFIEYERNLNRVQQLTNASAGTIGNLSKVIRSLGTSLGVASNELAQVAVTFTQTGLSAGEVEVALKAVAQASLTPTFSSMSDAAEGAIAVFRQFDITTNQLEATFDSINAVAGRFAVEFDDIVSAIQRGGGAFAVAAKGIDSGAESLNKFIALFTTARATTRESAETIATGIRTITARLQRLGTQVAIEDLIGVQLSDDGQFVGVYKAIEIISQRIKELGLSTQDVRFAQLVEELGGIRQISRVIPLLTEFETAQEALNVAQNASGSTSRAAAQAQQTLQVQLQKTLEAWNDLVGSFANNGPLRAVAGFVLQLTRGFLNFAKAFEPFAPIIATLAGIKIAKGLSNLLGGGLGGLLGGVDNSAQVANTAATQEQTSASQTTAQAINTNTNSLVILNGSINSLIQSINNFSVNPIVGNSGDFASSAEGFARGGVVPGTGNRDTVPAMLTPGEFVIRKNAVKALGTEKLHAMNKYATGGLVEQREVGAITLESGSNNAFITNDEISKAASKDRKENVDKILNKRRSEGAAGYNLKDRGLEDSLSKEVDNAIVESSATLIDNVSSALQNSPFGNLSPSLGNSTKDNLNNFFSSVNAGLKGSVFEALLNNILTQGTYSQQLTTQEANAPFDITNGIGTLSTIPGLEDLSDVKFNDIKATKARTTAAEFAKKISNELFETTSDSELQSLKIREPSSIKDAVFEAIISQVDKGIQTSNFNIPGRSTAYRQIDLPGLDLTDEEIGSNIDQLIKEGKLFQSKNQKGRNQGSFKVKEGKEDSRLTPQEIAQIAQTDKFAQGGFIQKFAEGGEPDPNAPSAKQLGFIKSLVGKFYSDEAQIEQFMSTVYDKQTASKQIQQLQNAKKWTGLFKTLLAEGKSVGFLGGRPFAYYSRIDTASSSFDELKDEETIRAFLERGKLAFGSYANNSSTFAQRRYNRSKGYRRAFGGFIPKFAEGGSAEDTVPALLTPGEFVINKKAAARIGSANLNKMNQADKISGFNKGGPVGFVQRFAEGGSVESQIGDIAKAVADATGRSLDEALKKIVGEVTRFKVESSRVTGAQTGLDRFSEPAQQTSNSATFDELQRAIIAVTGSADLLTDDFKNLSGSTAEGSDKFEEVYRALIKVSEQVEEFGEAALDAKSDLETIGNVQTSGRLSATIQAGRGGLGSRTLGSLSKRLGGIAGKIGGLWTKAAKGVVGIWQAGGKAVAAAITKASVVLGGIVGTLENAVGETENEAIAGGFGAAKGGLAGAATGAQLAASLGLGPVGTAVTAAGFAFVGAIKGASDAIQKVRLDKILRDVAEAAQQVAKGFEALENNVDGAEGQIVEGFGNALAASDKLLTISEGGTFGERAFERYVVPALAGLGVDASGQTAVDRSRLGGANALADAVLGAETRTDEERATGSIVSSIITSIVPGLDLLTDYLFTNSEAVLRARDAYAEGAGQNFENAIKFAEAVGSRASEAEVDVKSSIANLYFESLIAEEKKTLAAGEQISGQRLAQIQTEARERAAIDAAFAEAQKLGGGAVDLLNKKLANNRAAVVSQGNAIIEREQKLLDVRVAQARAVKEVEIAVANQIDIYRNFNAALKRVSTELERSSVELDEFLDFNQGATVDRTNEQVVQNLAAYSPQEVLAATSPVVSALGGSEQALQLQQNTQVARFLETQLPAVLRNTAGDPEGARLAIQQLRDQLEASGIDTSSEAVSGVFQQIAEKIDQNLDVGTLIDEIDTGIIQNFSKAVEQGQDTLLNSIKTYNDLLQQTIDLQDKLNASLNRFDDYMTKAAQIQLDAAVRFNEAIGKPSSLEELNASFNAGIKNLTTGLVERGALPGQTTDPTAIRIGIQDLRDRNKELEQNVKDREAEQADLRERQANAAPEDRAQFEPQIQGLEQERRANLIEIRDNTNALQRGKDALVELANSSARADNALQALAESQRQASGAANFLEKTFTNSAQENFQQAANLAVTREALSGNQQVLQTQAGRQAAFAGLDSISQILPQNEVNKIRADLLEQNAAATGVNLDAEVLNTGKSFREMLDVLRNPEETPEAKAFREATAQQSQANIELAKLELDATNAVQEAIQNVETAIKDLPLAFENAMVQALAQQDAAAGLNEAEKETLTARADVSAAEARVEELAGPAQQYTKAMTDLASTNEEIVRLRQLQNDIGEAAKYGGSGTEVLEGTGFNSSQDIQARINELTSQREEAKRIINSGGQEVVDYQAAQQELDRARANLEEKESGQAAQQARIEQLDEDAKARKKSRDEARARELEQIGQSSEERVQARNDKIKELEGDYGAGLATQFSDTAAPTPQQQSQAEAGARALEQAVGDDARQMNADAQYKVDHPDEFTPGEVQQARNYLNLGKPFENRGQAGTQTAPAAPPTGAAQTAPAAPRRPAPPTLDQRIGAITQYREQTGRLNPFQAKELERLQRQRRIEQRKAANAGVPTVAATTTEVSQGVATAQAAQQTEQQTQQQAPQDAFATAINNFKTYVDKLVNFEFPTIPETITLQANHNVVVTFQGAAALEGLNDSMRQVAIQETDKALAQIWDQSNGLYGGVPRSPAGGAGGAGNTALA